LFALLALVLLVVIDPAIAEPLGELKMP
jgi:hypothetical protein